MRLHGFALIVSDDPAIIDAQMLDGENAQQAVLGQRANGGVGGPLRAFSVRSGPEGGMPKRSRTPWTTSVGTLTSSNSARRLGLASAPARLGG